MARKASQPSLAERDSTASIGGRERTREITTTIMPLTTEQLDEKLEMTRPVGEVKPQEQNISVHLCVCFTMSDAVNKGVCHSHQVLVVAAGYKFCQEV